MARAKRFVLQNALPSEEFAALGKPKPILKWAGGKQQMLDVLLSKVPSRYNRYIEPFFGGGALFFALCPQDAVIADSNPELINLYKVVASNVEALINALQDMSTDKESFDEVRSVDASKLSPVEQAARTIYLNRTCFNGLYRVNRRGEFNVPYGHYKNPTICDESNLRLASKALKRAEIIPADYKKVLREYARPSDFIFLDPPYLPISTYSDFKRYTKEQFYEEDHRELAEEVRRLHALGCFVVLTNSNHERVYELYDGFSIEVHKTRRNINKDATKRTGEDVVVAIPARKRLIDVSTLEPLPEQMGKFPTTRFMGSKQNLIQQIWSVASQFHFDTVLDLFSGTGVVSYMFKVHGKEVFSRDYMAFCATFAEALIENNRVTLSDAEVEALCDVSKPVDDFVTRTFNGLYYNEEDNRFIDVVRANIPILDNRFKRAVAISALVRACMKKRARGIFAYTGQRYDDGRRDLAITLKEQFLEAVKLVNDAVFDNGRNNKAKRGDAMECRQKTDLVYIDPPYYSPLSDNEYVRRYHFVEGLALNWKGVELQEHTKTKKFKSYPTPFSSRSGTQAAFDTLFRHFRHSIILVSYSSNAEPSREEVLSIMLKHKPHVDVVSIDHRYSFANQGHKVNDIKNKVEEYLFIGY
ncbi:MAG: Dam family site-specific DNA-(adenine-N6)-methyltransferase [Blastocatellia bacterium]